VGIQDASRALDDHAVQLGRPQGVGERAAQAVQELEDPVLLGLDIVQPPLRGAEGLALPLVKIKKTCPRQNQKSEEQAGPHEKKSEMGSRNAEVRGSGLQGGRNHFAGSAPAGCILFCRP
jgi:hypothetical protein